MRGGQPHCIGSAIVHRIALRVNVCGAIRLRGGLTVTVGNPAKRSLGKRLPLRGSVGFPRFFLQCDANCACHSVRGNGDPRPVSPAICIRALFIVASDFAFHGGLRHRAPLPLRVGIGRS